ncbi:hypothetical protein C8Q77DRAFT_1132980 [Trametes polyzona]|nr:hypothetical protein C8Q77DRAFT_1132980 [Trametes polyzona]
MAKTRSKYTRGGTALRGRLRALMRQILVALSGDEHACMHWAVRSYFRKIYVEYGLELVGWPEDIPFTDLSDPEMRRCGRIPRLFALWETASSGLEARERQNPLDVAPNRDNRGLPINLGRSDIKKHRERRKVDAERFPPRYVRNGPKSDEWVTEAAEARAERAACYEHGEHPSDRTEEFSGSSSARSC